MIESIDLHRLAIVFIDTVVLWLALVVILNNRKRLESKLFVYMCIALVGWVDFAFFARATTDPNLSMLFLKIAWFATPLFFLTIYLFAIALLNEWDRFKKLTLFNSILTAIFAGVTGFTDTVISGRELSDNNNLSIQYGSLMWPFLISVCVLIFSVIYAFLSKRQKLRDHELGTTKPFVIGISIFYIANLVFNITLPIFLNVTNLYFIGDYSTIVLASLIAYSVVRHKFLGVKVVLSTFLISVIGMLLIVDLFIMSLTPAQYIFKGVVFIVYLAVAVLLIRSILTEIRQQQEILKIDRALKKSELRFKNLASEQKDIIDVMGHEIRTPLTAIIQELNIHKMLLIPKKADWLNNRVGEEEKFKMLKLIFESLDTIDKASAHAVSLVNDMLETARLDKQRFELNYSEFDIVHEAKISINIMSKTGKPNICKISFINKLPANFTVEADKTRIREALDALLSNAIKYRDRKKENSVIEVLLNRRHNDIVIEVKDNGIGIANEDIAKLGKKFVRLNSKSDDTLKRPGGTGLGLYVVKGIIAHHKGNFKISSPGIGRGSTFSIEFPIKNPSKNPVQINTEI